MDSILHFVLGNAFAAAVLALVAAGAARAFRRPALTHALWVLVMLKLVTPPLIAIPIAGHKGFRATGVTAGQPAPASPDAVAGSPSFPPSGAAAFMSSPDVRDPRAAPVAPRPADLAPPERNRTSPWNAFPWGKMAVWIGLAGSLVWFARAGLRIRRFRRSIALADPAPADVVREVERCAARIGLAKCPQVLLWRTVAPPMVWVFGRRTQLALPRDLLARLDTGQRAAVMTHELAHLARGDHWVRLLELVVTGLCWWHPVVWWARRQLQRAEEEACDAWVVWASPGAGETYASALLRTVDFLSEVRAGLSPLASGMGQAISVKRRLVMIVNENTPRILSGRSRLAFLGLAALFLPLTLVWAGAPDVPSLKEIRAGLKQRREKVRSLYVETVGETTSPFEPDELGRLQKHYKSWVGRKVEYHFAFQGEKRYSREITRPDPRQDPQRRSDKMWAYNGTSIWTRYSHDLLHPDGRTEKDLREVRINPPTGRMRFVYPNEWLAIHLGAAIAGPDLAAKDDMQDLFYPGSPPPPRRRTFTVADEIEEVDGAKCAVVSGTIETTFTSDDETHKSVRHVKLWLDLERGLALRKWEETRAPGEKWPKRRHRVVNSDFNEVEPGLWLPREVEIQRIAPAEEEAYPEPFRGKMILSSRIRVTRWIVNEVPDDVFDPYIKPGDEVYDHRSKRSWRQPEAAHDVENLLRLAEGIGIVPDPDEPVGRTLVVRVLADSPAEKAGIHTGDRIAAVNGTTIKRIGDMAALWAELPFDKGARRSLADNGVRLTLVREGRQVETTLPGNVLEGFAQRSGRDVR